MHCVGVCQLLLQHVSVYKETIIREPNHYLAKITHVVKSAYIELVQDVFSVMAAYCDLRDVCTVHCVRVYCLTMLRRINGS